MSGIWYPSGGVPLSPNPVNPVAVFQWLSTGQIKYREHLVDSLEQAPQAFPDMQAIHSWYASPAYQALISLRETVAGVVLRAYDT